MNVAPSTPPQNKLTLNDLIDGAKDHPWIPESADEEGIKFIRNLFERLRSKCRDVADEPFDKEYEEAVCEPFGKFVDEAIELTKADKPLSEAEMVKRIPNARIVELAENMRERIRQAHAESNGFI